MTLPHFDLPSRLEPLVLIWPAPGNPAAFWHFSTPDEWRAFVNTLALDPRVPDIVKLKFERAQKLFLLGWIDTDLIKGAELVALTALELALKDRFGHVVPRLATKKIVPSSPDAMMAQPIRYSFKALLRHLVDNEGLTDAQIPMIARCGGTATGQLTGQTKPTLEERRNAMAHGDPFDGMSTSGLVELVRDLIMFAYRHYLADMPPVMAQR
ncbi:hypothetical protein [Sphingobium subterraneum]|uniref:Uncharacterized protein n=1 Tax=Sphingobium subterraneum TaxID=627688 RepID=A0A841J5K8_9SPHN|nr:hypothetical protein [Sphingobium subterraneum]MBB6125632.1 hypothetical protein [Sphingobium subterraneum]